MTFITFWPRNVVSAAFAVIMSVRLSVRLYHSGESRLNGSGYRSRPMLCSLHHTIQRSICFSGQNFAIPNLEIRLPLRRHRKLDQYIIIQDILETVRDGTQVTIIY